MFTLCKNNGLVEAKSLACAKASPKEVKISDCPLKLVLDALANCSLDNLWRGRLEVGD